MTSALDRLARARRRYEQWPTHENLYALERAEAAAAMAARNDPNYAVRLEAARTKEEER